MHSFWIFLYGNNMGETQPATWCPGQWAVLLPSLPPGPEVSYFLSPVVERDVEGEYNWAQSLGLEGLEGLSLGRIWGVGEGTC